MGSSVRKESSKRAYRGSPQNIEFNGVFNNHGRLKFVYWFNSKYPILSSRRQTATGKNITPKNANFSNRESEMKITKVFLGAHLWPQSSKQKSDQYYHQWTQIVENIPLLLAIRGLYEHYIQGKNLNSMG